MEHIHPPRIGTFSEIRRRKTLKASLLGFFQHNKPTFTIRFLSSSFRHCRLLRRVSSKFFPNTRSLWPLLYLERQCCINQYRVLKSDIVLGFISPKTSMTWVDGWTLGTINQRWFITIMTGNIRCG